MIFDYFLQVEDTCAEPILEPKNGIAAKNLRSKTLLVGSILEPIFGFLGFEKCFVFFSRNNNNINYIYINKYLKYRFVF